MILYRYIAREMLVGTLAISSILFFIIVGSRFARILESVASGRIGLDIMGQLTLFYTPYALQIIIPLSFVLALMLTFGRLYMQSEMAVIQSSGVGPRQLLILTLLLGLVMAGLTGLNSIYINPKAKYASEMLMQEQQQKTGFESLTPGQFTRLGQQVVFLEGLNSDKNQLQQVFIAQTQAGKTQLAMAQKGYQQTEKPSMSRFLVLEKGTRYELPQAELTSDVLNFERYALKTASYQEPTVQEKIAMLPLNKLLQDSSLAAQIELQWRLSLPLQVIIMVFIALPLTKVNPRQGRLAALVPVLFLQLLFLGLLMTLQGLISKGQWPVQPGLWLVHLVFLALGLLLSWRRGMFNA